MSWITCFTGLRTHYACDLHFSTRLESNLPDGYRWRHHRWGHLCETQSEHLWTWGSWTRGIVMGREDQTSAWRWRWSPFATSHFGRWSKPELSHNSSSPSWGNTNKKNKHKPTRPVGRSPYSTLMFLEVASSPSVALAPPAGNPHILGAQPCSRLVCLVVLLQHAPPHSLLATYWPLLVTMGSHTQLHHDLTWLIMKSHWRQQLPLWLKRQHYQNHGINYSIFIGVWHIKTIV